MEELTQWTKDLFELEYKISLLYIPTGFDLIHNSFVKILDDNNIEYKIENQIISDEREIRYSILGNNLYTLYFKIPILETSFPRETMTIGLCYTIGSLNHNKNPSLYHIYYQEDIGLFRLN